MEATNAFDKMQCFSSSSRGYLREGGKRKPERMDIGGRMKVA
jgi:hypothetical protein